MRRAVVVFVAVLSLGLSPAAPPAESWRAALTDGAGLTLHGVTASPSTLEGKKAVQLAVASNSPSEAFAVVAGPLLQDGRIDVDLAGRPGASADPTARGFVGIAFRVKGDQSAFECFYLRPTNGRADDQLRRNHSTQYISFPDYPWEKLRTETPGVYESYVDLAPGAWTHVGIEFHDRRASLYVNRAPQPVLIVNDLKLAPAAGAVALWLGPGTEAWFRDLVVSSR